MIWKVHRKHLKKLSIMFIWLIFLLNLSDFIVLSNLARFRPAIFPGYFQTLISRLQRTLLRSIFSFTRKNFLTENSQIRSWPHFDKKKSANLELWDSRSFDIKLEHCISSILYLKFFSVFLSPFISSADQLAMPSSLFPFSLSSVTTFLFEVLFLLGLRCFAPCFVSHDGEAKSSFNVFFSQEKQIIGSLELDRASFFATS